MKIFFRISLLLCGVVMGFNSAQAQYTITIDDVKFDSSTGTITAYNWPDNVGTSIKIPEKLDGVDVKILGTPCFYNINYQDDATSGLTEVVIPSTVTQIGQSVFEYNQISSLTIGENVDSIGKYAFSNNNLTEVVIPNSVSFIDTCAFSGNDISSITFPKDLRIIYCGTFESNNISTLNLPQSLESIEIDAFYGNNISQLNLPESLTYLSGFRENSFTEINIPSHINKIGSHAFSYNPTTSLTIENGVKEIGSYAFSTNWGVHYGLDNLKYGQDYSLQDTIEIPSSVTKIDDYAFEENGSLAKIIFNEGLVTIGIKAFASCSFSNVEIPKTVKIIGSGAFRGNKIASLTLPDSLEEINASAFLSNQITSISIPGTVTEVGDNAFYANTEMDTIIINDGVETIGYQCFSYCQSISSISLPTSLLVIEEKAFNNCWFSSITLPNVIKEDEVFSHWATYLGDNTNVTDIVDVLSSDDELGYVAVFSDDATSLETESTAELYYTNPVYNVFKINQSGSLNIYNITGEKVASIKSYNQENINLSHFSRGVYIYILDNTTSGKFIKK